LILYIESLMKTQGYFHFTFFLLVLIFGSLTTYGQDKTAATDLKKEIKKKKEAPDEKTLLFIVKSESKGILYGNKCFLDVQHRMGFEYLIQPKGQPLNRNEVGRNLHNFGIKFALIFKNGPFYGIKLSKKKKECRELTGDFVG